MTPKIHLFFQVILLGCASAQPDNGHALPEANPSPTTTASPSPDFPLAGKHLMFYNLENLFDTQPDAAINDHDFTPGSKLQWTTERLNTKLKHLAEAITLAGEDLPVLVGVCEVENREVFQRLANEPVFRPGHYQVVHFDSPDERGIDTGLLFDKQVFTLVRSEALNVPLVDDHTRDVLHVELGAYGHSFHVFVNHWPSRREGQEKSEPKRMAAAEVVKQAVAAIEVDGDTHIIIMGDFNDGPTDLSIKRGLGAGCTPSSKGLIDLMCLNQPVGHGSHQFNGHWEYLDQFIVSAPLLPLVEEANAVWHETLLFNHPKFGQSPDKTYSGGRYKGGYSDHLPIKLRFK